VWILQPSIPTLKKTTKQILTVGIATIAKIANRAICVYRVSLAIGAKIVICASIATRANRHTVATFANRSILANLANF
jgi:hypothetical protein